MFSCEFWETSKNTFFTKHLRWLLLYFIFFFNCVSLRTSYIKSCFDVPTTQMSIFIYFVSTGTLFEGDFVPVSILKNHFRLTSFLG